MLANLVTCQDDLVDTFVKILMVFGFVSLKCGFYGFVRMIWLSELEIKLKILGLNF
jgi:hypothetical protein